MINSAGAEDTAPAQIIQPHSHSFHTNNAMNALATYIVHNKTMLVRAWVCGGVGVGVWVCVCVLTGQALLSANISEDMKGQFDNRGSNKTRTKLIWFKQTCTNPVAS